MGLPQPESSGGASSGDGDGEEGTSSQDDEVDEGCGIPTETFCRLVLRFPCLLPLSVIVLTNRL